MKREDIKTIIKSNGQTYSIRISRERIFSPKEWNLFLINVKKEKRLIFEFLLNTGARISEAINVKKEDINFKESYLTLKVVKKRTPYSDGDERKIKISSQLLKKLKVECNKIKAGEKLFNVSKTSVSQLMKRAMKKSKIEDYWNFSLHNIRKTSESWLVFLNVNSLIVLKRLGHNQSTALKHYIQPEIYDNKYRWGARLLLGDLYA